jgi:hypothetical protein
MNSRAPKPKAYKMVNKKTNHHHHLTSSDRVVFPNLGAWTLDKANNLSRGGPFALGLPLKMTVSPDNTFFTTALFTIFFFLRKRKKEKKRNFWRESKIKSSKLWGRTSFCGTWKMVGVGSCTWVFCVHATF